MDLRKLYDFIIYKMTKGCQMAHNFCQKFVIRNGYLMFFFTDNQNLSYQKFPQAE